MIPSFQASPISMETRKKPLIIERDKPRVIESDAKLSWEAIFPTTCLDGMFLRLRNETGSNPFVRLQIMSSLQS